MISAAPGALLAAVGVLQGPRNSGKTHGKSIFSLLAVLERFRAPRGRQGALGAILGRSWGALGVLLAALGALLGALGALLAALGALLAALGALQGPKNRGKNDGKSNKRTRVERKNESEQKAARDNLKRRFPFSAAQVKRTATGAKHGRFLG